MIFTQAIFPHGTRRRVSIDMPAMVEYRAKTLEALGWRWWIECHPTTQVIVMWAQRGPEDGEAETLAEVRANGPDVPATVARLVDRVWQTLRKEAEHGSGDQ